MNVAIVGTGQWSAVIYEKLKRQNDITQIFFVGRGDKVGTIHNGERCISILEIKSKLIDSAFIAIPIKDLYLAAKTCLLSGVNVFVEKPGAQSLEELTHLVELAQRKRLKFMVGYQYLVEAETHLLKNELNPPVDGVEVEHLWLKSRKADSSIVDNLLSHEIARLVFATGNNLTLSTVAIRQEADILEGQLKFDHGDKVIKFDFYINQRSSFVTFKHTKYKGFDLDWMTRSFGRTKADLVNTEICFFLDWAPEKIEQAYSGCIIETRRILDQIKREI